MEAKCVSPNQTNLEIVKGEIKKNIGVENVFTEAENKKLTDLLMKKISEFGGGGCKDDSEKDAAKMYLIALSGLITFIIQQVISRIRDFKKTNDELINENALAETVKIKSSLTKIKAEVYSYLFSTTEGIQQLDPTEQTIFYSNRSKTTAVEAKITNLLNSTLNILKSVGIFCATIIIKLISTRGLDFNMENVQAIANEIIDNVYNNLGSLIHLTSSNISEGFTNYVEGKESTLSTILVPLEEWICNWLYNVRGGQKLKKRKTRRRNHKKRRTQNNKKK